MLTEKEREYLQKICPAELDFKVFLTLVQTGKSVGEDVHHYEEVTGKKCHWCSLNTAENQSAISYDDSTHEKFCPIRLSREHLYNLGLPLQKGRFIMLVEIQSGGKFLKAWDEEIYYVGEADTTSIAEKIVKGIIERQYENRTNVTYEIKFASVERIKEYRF